MDYIALNHNPNNIYGVHYNSPKPIGGIRYYTPKKNTVQINPETKKTAIIVDTPIPKNKISTKEYKNPEPKKITSQRNKIEKVSLEDVKDKAERDREEDGWQKIQGNTFKKTEELISKENLKREEEAKEERNKDYIVEVQGTKVNFSELGIRKKHLSRSERRWLRKAQNYFLTVEENGRKIGSAESYTTMGILEALWRTAEEVDIDPKRFIVQMYNETRFNPNLKGRAGERGLGQFKKSTAKLYGYDWEQMTSGTKGFAYQARAAAEFVKSVGELAYNGSGHKAKKYKDKISMRIDKIDTWDSDCVMKTVAYCSS